MVINYFDSIINSDDKYNADIKNAFNININYNYSNENDMLESLSNKNINNNIKDSINIDNKLKNKLYNLTKRNIDNIDIYSMDYYKVNDNNYIVGVSNKEKNYYYNYKVENGLFNRKKYINNGIYDNNIN